MSDYIEHYEITEDWVVYRWDVTRGKKAVSLRHNSCSERGHRYWAPKVIESTRFKCAMCSLEPPDYIKITYLLQKIKI